MKKLYRCKICKDIHWGVAGPGVCPTCGHKNVYKEIEKIPGWSCFLKITGKKFWRCTVCNDLHFGKRGVKKCPTCQQEDVYVQISEQEFKTILKIK